MDLETATKWIDARLAESGVAREGPLELVRERPWGSVARLGSSRGTLWLKAPGPETAFEVPLYGLLSEVVPEATLEPIALDTERGWVLLPDGGDSLGDTQSGAALTDGLINSLGRYAALQRALEPHVDKMLDLGVEDFRPPSLLGRLDEAFEAARKTAPAQAGGLEELEQRRPQIEAWIMELEGRPGRPSLDHNDLHPWNILGDPSDATSLRFYDWGDSVVQHPFAAAALPLGFVERAGTSSLERAIDAYLEPFSDLGTRAELVETLELAGRTARIARTLTWARATASGEVEERFAHAPYETLESILDDSWTSST